MTNRPGLSYALAVNWISVLLTAACAFSCACPARDSSTLRPLSGSRAPSAQPTVSSVAVEAPPSTVSVETEPVPSRQVADGEREPTSLRAEVVEAHTVRVGTLRAITVEARELRVKKVLRVRHYPVAKDEGMVKLEGNVVEADDLEAHHVIAEVIIADEVVAHRVTKPRGATRWPISDSTTDVVVNRCVHLAQRVDGVAARCARGLALAP